MAQSAPSDRATLPPLPPLPLSDDVRKTHSFSNASNWVIPNVLMQGGRPGFDTEAKMLQQVRNIVKDGGCRTFVSLQAECVPEEGAVLLDDGGDRKPIPKDLPGYAKHVASVVAESGEGPPPAFVYYGILGMQTAKSTESLCSAVMDLAARIRKGEKLYVHCGGGAGRAGLVSACLLGALYEELEADAAMQYTTGLCQCRNLDGREDFHCSSPETEGQRGQVREFFEKIRSK
ncbi:hypothetical protein ACHAXT_013065 [Thalassiosira profunda]